MDGNHGTLHGVTSGHNVTQPLIRSREDVDSPKENDSEFSAATGSYIEDCVGRIIADLTVHDGLSNHTYQFLANFAISSHLLQHSYYKCWNSLFAILTSWKQGDRIHTEQIQL